MFMVHDFYVSNIFGITEDIQNIRRNYCQAISDN